MSEVEDSGERLAKYRAEWPTRVTWREVHEEDPEVFRSAARGALMLIRAVLLTLLASCLTMDAPVPIPLPDWLDWARALFILAALFGALTGWIWGLVLLSMPADIRRALAIRRFAQRRGLGFARFGYMPRRVGIFFAEGGVAGSGASAAAARGPAGTGRRGGRVDRTDRANRANPTDKPMYNAQFAISGGGLGPNPMDPPLQIAVATYTGAKGDPRGPRPAFRYLSMQLSRPLPHLMIDSRRNGSLRSYLPASQRLTLEGDFGRYFTTYVPAGYERDALELLTPDVMVCLIDHGKRWDIEVVEDRLIVASSRSRRYSDRSEYTAMLRFSELVGAELGHQAATYSDPRASKPRSQIAAPGRRLRRRSAAWAIAGFIAVMGTIFGAPYVLSWLLDWG